MAEEEGEAGAAARAEGVAQVGPSREQARVAEIQRGVLYRPEIDDALRKKGVIE